MTRAESLQLPINDRQGGPLVELKKVPLQPRSSGYQVKIHCGILLEGFRPGRYVRVYPSTWNLVALPKEERFFNRE